jgi:hypothetical protein
MLASFVIPAKAGIQVGMRMDSGLRRNDGRKRGTPNTIGQMTP